MRRLETTILLVGVGAGDYESLSLTVLQPGARGWVGARRVCLSGRHYGE